MLGPAARLIENPRHFTTGAIARDIMDVSCGTGPSAFPVCWDALGAILWGYRHTEIENRQAAAKRVFEACRARHDHARLGQLDWAEAFSILKDCGV